jgi:hypothetical protein
MEREAANEPHYHAFNGRFITIVAVGLGSINAQQAPGNPWCDVKWMKSEKSATYREFMDRCLRLAHGEQLSPADWQQYQRWQRAATPAFVLPQRLDAQTWCTLNHNCLTPQHQKTQQQPPTYQETADWDKKLEARSRQMFPSVGQEKERLQWLQDQENVQLDRQQGNSYSLRVR